MDRLRLDRPRGYSGNVVRESSDKNVIENYLIDESRIIRGYADKVYYPLDERQVSHLLVKAWRNGYRVTVSGGGTGLAGSRVPLGGVVLSTEYLRSVSRECVGKEYLFKYGGATYLLKYYISEEDGSTYVCAPVGMPVEAFINALSGLGLIYPPNPTEKTAFLGGNLSTHASGKWSFIHGPLRKYVNRLRIVLPFGGVIEIKRGEYRVEREVVLEPLDGEPITMPIPQLYTPRVRKSSAWPNIRIGTDLIDFFIGMDGILGVYTEVEYVLPRSPKNIYSIFAVFRGEDDILDVVEEFRRSSEEYGVWAIEYLDYKCMELIRNKLGRDFNLREGGGILYIDVAGDEDIIDRLASVNEVLDSHNSVETYASDDPRWVGEAMHIRHLVPESVNKFISMHGTHRVASDASVPDSRFREAMTFYREYCEESGLNYLLYGHIGDSHLHMNFLPRDDDELREAMHHLTNILRKMVSMGGSVTAEHGFGKKSFLDEDGNLHPLIHLQYGYEGELMVRETKEAVDKKYILNVGNIIPPPR